jgi:CheY-like chemotaxis protein
MKKRVIVCDDDNSIVDIATIVLTDAGYDVIPVTNSSKIFETITSSMPDLVLIDLSMPDMNGEDIIHTLKQNPITRHIPVIIISGLENTGDIAKKTGADDFINKPFDIEELEATVKKYTII